MAALSQQGSTRNGGTAARTKQVAALSVCLAASLLQPFQRQRSTHRANREPEGSDIDGHGLLSPGIKLSHRQGSYLFTCLMKGLMHCSEEMILHLNSCLRGEGWPAAPRLWPQGDSEICPLSLCHATDCADGLEAWTTTGQCLSVCMGSGSLADTEVATDNNDIKIHNGLLNLWLCLCQEIKQQWGTGLSKTKWQQSSPWLSALWRATSLCGTKEGRTL